MELNEIELEANSRQSNQRVYVNISPMKEQSRAHAAMSEAKRGLTGGGGRSKVTIDDSETGANGIKQKKKNNND